MAGPAKSENTGASADLHSKFLFVRIPTFLFLLFIINQVHYSERDRG